MDTKSDKVLNYRESSPYIKSDERLNKWFCDKKTYEHQTRQDFDTGSHP